MSICMSVVSKKSQLHFDFFEMLKEGCNVIGFFSKKVLTGSTGDYVRKSIKIIANHKKWCIASIGS